MEFIPIIFVIVLLIALTPTSAPKGRAAHWSAPKGRRGRRSKGFLTYMLKSQSRTQKRNAHHSGVMASSRGVGARGGRRKR